MCVGGAHKDWARCSLSLSIATHPEAARWEREWMRAWGFSSCEKRAHYAGLEGLTRGGRRTRESSAALGNFYNCSLCGGGGVRRKYWLVYIGKEGLAASRSSFLATPSGCSDCILLITFPLTARVAQFIRAACDFGTLATAVAVATAHFSEWMETLLGWRCWRTKALSLRWTHPPCRTAPCCLFTADAIRVQI